VEVGVPLLPSTFRPNPAFACPIAASSRKILNPSLIALDASRLARRFLFVERRFVILNQIKLCRSFDTMTSFKVLIAPFLLIESVPHSFFRAEFFGFVRLTSLVSGLPVSKGRFENYLPFWANYSFIPGIPFFKLLGDAFLGPFPPCIKQFFAQPLCLMNISFFRSSFEMSLV